MPGRHDPIYWTARWRRESKRWLSTRPRCELRLPGCTLRATTVDHYISWRDGAEFWDKSNWKAACRHCNSVKANKARATRARQGGNSREW